MVELRESFDRAPQVYDDGRPPYPDEAVDWIIRKTGITVEETLLEIGPGTGQATLKFAQRGYRIHGVERGSNLARLLMQKCEPFNVSVDISAFEDWTPPSAFKTPLILCAASFHWLDPTIKYKKCFDLLNDDGHLVLLWNRVPERPMPLLQKAMELLWQYYPEKRGEQKTKEEFEHEMKLEIANSAVFTLADYFEYKWISSMTRDDMAKCVFSQSLFLALDEAKQKSLSAKVAELFKDFDDVIEADAYATVYLAKKT